jgi:two-component system response regulator GlrR
VRTADSGETALAPSPIARPRRCITDLRMPGIDGMQLFEAIHRRHPALPVIILTAHGTIPDAVTRHQRGVFGFLTKPFDSQELLQKVGAALAVSGDDAPGEGDRCRMARGIITRSPEDGGPAAPGAARGRLGCERAHLWRLGHGQGTARTCHPSRESARREAVHCRELRRDPRRSARVRAFRPRARRFTGAIQAHKGLFQAATAARSSSTRSATCRCRCR